MPTPDDPRDEALRKLRERADALQASTARPAAPDHGHQAVGRAYGLIGQLIGGPLVGLAFGFGFDSVFDTAPAGLIVGILLGFGVAVFLAWRTAERYRVAAGPGAALPDDEEDEER